MRAAPRRRCRPHRRPRVVLGLEQLAHARGARSRGRRGGTPALRCPRSTARSECAPMPGRRTTQPARAARRGPRASVPTSILPAMLERIIEAASELVDARYGALGVLDDRRSSREFITVGIDEQARGHRRPARGPRHPRPRSSSIQGRSPARPRHAPTATASRRTIPPMRSFLGVPIRVRDEVFGNLYLTDKTTRRRVHRRRRGARVALATAAGMAIENARLRARAGARPLEDRERIARDLHDTVIQRLFADRLTLQRCGPARPRRGGRANHPGRRRPRRDHAEIRTAIFVLQAPAGAGASRFDLRLGRRRGRGARVLPGVHFDGPIDGSLREGRRASSGRPARGADQRRPPRPCVTRDVTVELGTDGVVRVIDDGKGPPRRPANGRGRRHLEEGRRPCSVTSPCRLPRPRAPSSSGVSRSQRERCPMKLEEVQVPVLAPDRLLPLIGPERRPAIRDHGNGRTRSAGGPVVLNVNSTAPAAALRSCCRRCWRTPAASASTPDGS